MAGYTTREVARLVELSPHHVRAFARAGLLTATRDRRGWYRYSFQDVVLLQTAKCLHQAHVSSRKIWRTLRVIKKTLPLGRPLSTIRVLVQDNEVLVKDRDSIWHSESGQAQLNLSISNITKEITPLVNRAVVATQRCQDINSDDWFVLAVDLELIGDKERAKYAYRQVLSLNQENVETHVNLGRLLHGENRIKEAEDHYRMALELAPNHVFALFNLAIALEDRKRFNDAINIYKKVLLLNPEFADAHFNLARLYEQVGHPQSALRHISRFHSLIEEMHIT